jgi:hypothetical protein
MAEGGKRRVAKALGIALALLGRFNDMFRDYLADELRYLVVFKFGAGGLECLAHDMGGGIVEIYSVSGKWQNRRHATPHLVYSKTRLS